MSDSALHSGQQQALEQLVQIVDQPVEGDFATVVALTGISGVGKDSLWDAVKDRFGEKKFVPDYSLEFSPEEYQSRRGNIFTTTTPLELERLRWKGRVVPVVVKGMTADEMSTYLTQFRDKFGNFTEEQLVTYSLGIPLVAQRFFQNQDIGEEELAMIAGSHVRNCVSGKYAGKVIENPEDLDDYLSIRMNDMLVKAFRESERAGMFTPSFQSQLPQVLEKQAEINRRYRKNLASPFFVCQDSAELYAHMLARGGSNPEFDLFVPNLSRDQCERITKELFEPHAEYHLQEHGTRYEMFGGNFRKVTMVLNDGWRSREASSEGQPEDIKKFQRALNDGKLPLEVAPDNSGSLYLHAHEHSGLTLNQLMVGMAAETLLQHMGVAYIVDYGIAEKAFKYNPASNSLNEIGRFSREVLRGK